VTDPEAPWNAELWIRRPDPASASRLERALRPEASREVPRSSATIDRPDPRSVRLEVVAADTGALRAAVNAYLGWVRLALEAERIAARSPGARPGPAL
jgi:tRNA threonylcarbamoyladenosine modification (KEOPS) complex  Pcc1 subunit